MTPEERRQPTLIDGSRRLRIAQGSGTSTQEVNALLKQFKMVSQMVKSMTKVGKGGKGKRMGGLPPGMGGLGGLGGLPELPSG
jgi:signal recognition particle subunit SRP54